MKFTFYPTYKIRSHHDLCSCEKVIPPLGSDIFTIPSEVATHCTLLDFEINFLFAKLTFESSLHNLDKAYFNKDGCFAH